jgi:hypothetical protein
MPTPSHARYNQRQRTAATGGRRGSGHERAGDAREQQRQRRLLWTRGSDHVIVRVVDGGAGDSFVFEVDACDALDAFYHPYAYASRLEVPCPSPERESTFDVAVPEVVQR